MEQTFKNWLSTNEMAAFTGYRFGKPIPNRDDRDSAGLKRMSRPGFRDADRQAIHRDSPDVERRLSKATEPMGIHWVIGYLEPEEGLEEDNPEHWEKYRQSAVEDGKSLLADFQKEYQPFFSKAVTPAKPPTPENTIVYIKPTSRVHTLSPHEQVHNIGHAIWLRNPELMNRAKQEIQQAVHILQQAGSQAEQQSRAQGAPPSPPPTEAEMTIVLARLVNLISYQRSLVLNPGDLSSGPKTALTSFQNFDEVIFELFPAFINGGGQLNLYPRGPGKVAKFDRAQAIPPNQEVIAQRGVRPWVWEKMVSDKAAWTEVSKILTGIIVEALHASTWAKKGGPIFPYQKLTTQP